MALSRSAKILAVLVMVTLPAAALAENPCANAQRRALILSGGGLKGAFEAGAVYHLVIDRGCDFHDIAGVSVGALNGAILAQAQPSDDAFQSRHELGIRTGQMVAVWENLKGARDVVRPRKLGGIRFALFGAEHINDFSPLRRVLESAVSIDALAEGRPLRVGVTSFADGSYREVWMNGREGSEPRERFMEYLFASSMLPVIGRMPRIAPATQEPDDSHVTQFADGGMRHVTPVASYFRACAGDCAGATRAEHQPLEQLFVIGTSPYERGSELFPIADAHCCRPGTHLFTKGSHVMRRAIALMADTPYRADLEAMLVANDLLTWRAQLYDAAAGSGAGALPSASEFPVESYNRDSNGHAPSRPYLIALVAPEKENVDISDLLALSPAMVRDQLLSGCLAADKMMSSRFALPSLRDQCESRFGSRKVVPGVELAAR